jgi:hypothetical protein
MHRYVIEVPPLSLSSAEWESEVLMPPTRAAPAVASEGDRIRARNERAWLHRRLEYGDRISLAAPAHDRLWQIFDLVPVPDILYRLPYLLENRPRRSKAMLDVAGAKARLRDVRPGAWLISPYTGWKWAKWPSGDIGWLPADTELPATLRVAARNDVQ